MLSINDNLLLDHKQRQWQLREKGDIVGWYIFVIGKGLALS